MGFDNDQRRQYRYKRSPLFGPASLPQIEDLNTIPVGFDTAYNAISDGADGEWYQRILRAVSEGHDLTDAERRLITAGFVPATLWGANE